MAYVTAVFTVRLLFCRTVDLYVFFFFGENLGPETRDSS